LHSARGYGQSQNLKRVHSINCHHQWIVNTSSVHSSSSSSGSTVAVAVAVAAAEAVAVVVVVVAVVAVVAVVVVVVVVIARSHFGSGPVRHRAYLRPGVLQLGGGRCSSPVARRPRHGEREVSRSSGEAPYSGSCPGVLTSAVQARPPVRRGRRGHVGGGQGHRPFAGGAS